MPFTVKGMPLHMETVEGDCHGTTQRHTRSRPKNASALLQADHHQVRELFRAYRAAKDQAAQWESAL